MRMPSLMIAAIVLIVSAASAHDNHERCRFGNTWRGDIWHYHPNRVERAVPCPPPQREEADPQPPARGYEERPIAENYCAPGETAMTVEGRRACLRFVD